MKEINLEKILKEVTSHNAELKLAYYPLVLMAMREACNQAIDLCAENAKIKEIVNSNPYSGFAGEVEYKIDKKSILKTKDEIK